MVSNIEMTIEHTRLKGAVLIHPFYMEDSRGFFEKDFSYDYLRNNGFEYVIRETFTTFSKKGVVRGLHFQNQTLQPKIVRCVSGHIFDVIVDLRKDSPTFKEWESFDLRGDEKVSLIVPKGFAHGFMALEDSIVSYKCSECFSKENDSGIVWNDDSLSIDWPIQSLGDSEVIISEKDSKLQSLRSFLCCYDKFGY